MITPSYIFYHIILKDQRILTYHSKTYALLYRIFKYSFSWIFKENFYVINSFLIKYSSFPCHTFSVPIFRVSNRRITVFFCNKIFRMFVCFILILTQVASSSSINIYIQWKYKGHKYSTILRKLFICRYWCSSSKYILF